MYGLIERLYPLCRSLTGNGVRETLDVVGEWIDLQRTEVPTGTPVFDWTIPKEWNIRDAYIKAPSGSKVLDFRDSNLHVVGYSAPVHERMELRELKKHLHSLPEHPDWIPYRTAYYSEGWGFCVEHAKLTDWTDGWYEVHIDASLEDGALSYGEWYLPGTRDEEIVFFTHVCHPSLCNDNLSGIAVAASLARALSQAPGPHLYSYRLVLAPATLGSLTWLSRNQDKWRRIKGGLVLGLLGDPAGFTYKRSRCGRASIDRLTEAVLQARGDDYRVVDFSPYGYDERQFCSPGVNLPIGRLTRSPNQGYAQYHTSADGLDLMSAERLEEALSLCLDVVAALEADRVYVNTRPYGEPQLGKYGLYRRLGGAGDPEGVQMAMLWVLNLTDGQHSLSQIAERAGLEFGMVREAASMLEQAGLLVAAG